MTRRRSGTLRLMVWNLCGGGRGTPAGDVLDLIGDLVAEVAPDVLCCTETRGATDRLIGRLAAAGHAGYRGFRLAAEGTDDNLSILTRLPVRTRLPHPAGRTVDSYNFGGLRLELPGGTGISVFDTWLRFDVGIAEALEAAAAELADGRPRSRSDEELTLLELPQLANIEEILTEHLPAAVPDDTEPVIMAGGFNTESHLDWSAEPPTVAWPAEPAQEGGAAEPPQEAWSAEPPQQAWSAEPTQKPWPAEPAQKAWSAEPPRGGRAAGRPVGVPMSPQWQVTRRLAKAGFVDAYRAVHVDPRSQPGSTFNPLDPGQRLPHRIDYVFVGGSGVDITDARVIDTRLARHGAGPFYSDHAALVVDLAVA